MYQQQGNKQLKKWLGWLVIVSLLATIPIIGQRIQTEQSASQVEIVFNYRNLVEMAACTAKPDVFMNQQLERLKHAGVHSMAIFESTLTDLQAERHIMLYRSQDIATLKRKISPLNENYTYILFPTQKHEKLLAPIITDTFRRFAIPIKSWQYEHYRGLYLETPFENAVLKPMPQNPLVVQKLRQKGFAIVPRISDVAPYHPAQTEQLLREYHKIGVKRILFDGGAVKGFQDDEETNRLHQFAQLLTKYQIGIGAIEGLKKPQKGIEKLASLINYNVVRVHSLSEQESFNEVDVLADRFSLATKDRSIRMLYLNAAVKKDPTTAEIVTAIDNIIDTLQTPGQAIAMMKQNGFTLAQAEPFTVGASSWYKYIKILVTIGSIALIAMLISYFIPMKLWSIFILGVSGSMVLFGWKPALLDQLLALGVAISTPTIALILAIRHVDNQRLERSVIVRCKHAVFLFWRTTAISLLAIPFIITLLHHMSYRLLLDQFRGVSLLHVLPLFLTTVYICLYRGQSVGAELRRWLNKPFTILWALGLAIVGLVGLYYFTRTGNEGTVSTVEKSFRSLLEHTFGVRPRNKEFLLAHPLFLVAIYIVYRYRSALYLFVFAAIGQLSMVDTFAHIHTPVMISALRTCFGLALGFLIGIIGIFIGALIERCWDTWCAKR